MIRKLPKTFTHSNGSPNNKKSAPNESKIPEYSITDTTTILSLGRARYRKSGHAYTGSRIPDSRSPPPTLKSPQTRTPS